MTVERTKLLASLEAVQPGLSPREIIEQSACFVFRDGLVYTYNDEISCHCPTPLGKEIKGAVHAPPLTNLLRKMTEPEITVEVEKGEMLIRGKGKRAGLRLESEIVLPISLVEKPKTWNRLPDEFGDAVKMVQHCAAQDETRFVATCVHLHPKWVEACDDKQACRWTIKTGLQSAILARQASIKHIPQLGMTEFAETESWLHFRNSNGLVLSCRRFVESYPDLNRVLETEKGVTITLPKGVEEASNKAEIFSSQNDVNHVWINLLPGKIRIKAEGATGWYSETKSVEYRGKPMQFLIPPSLLVDIVQKESKCHIANKRLKIQTDNYQYVVCLTQPSKKDEQAE